MGLHLYDNPGPRETATRTVAGKVSTDVRLWDGNDHVALSYDDLDVLDETVRMFLEARSAHLVALMDGRSEIVRADQLEYEDLAIHDGELVLIEQVALTDETVIVRFARRYAGLFDTSPGAVLSVTLPRAQRVKRLMPDANLAVVQ
jgi:hypothetical protein